MKSCLGDSMITNYVIIGRPYSVMEVRKVVYDNAKHEYIFSYNYWLNHKDYGYLMHMFGVYDHSFHDMFDDMDDSCFDSYVMDYLDNIDKLENEKE